MLRTRTHSASTTSQFLLLYLIGFVVLGGTSRGQGHSSNAQALLEFRVMVRRFTPVSIAFTVCAMGSSKSLSPQSTKSRSSDDLASTVVLNFTVAVSSARHECRYARTSECASCEVALVMRAFASLPANNFARVNPIVIVVAATVIAVMTMTIKASHGQRMVPIRLSVTTPWTNLAFLMTVIILLIAMVTITIPTGMVAMLFLVPDHNDSGLLAWYYDRCGRRCFLNNDLLGFVSLTNNNGRGRGTLTGVVLGLFAITIDIMAVRVLVAVLVPSLDLDLVIMATIARPSVVDITVLAFVDGYAAFVSVAVGVLSVQVPFVKGRASVLLRARKGRSWALGAALLILLELFSGVARKAGAVIIVDLDALVPVFATGLNFVPADGGAAPFVAGVAIAITGVSIFGHGE